MTVLSSPNGGNGVIAELDVIVIGAGIAGAGIAADLAGDRRVAVLEMEEHLGTHATGRSAALFTELYGNEIIRRLTRASRDTFLEGAEGQPFATPRGCLYVATGEQIDHLDRFSSEPGIAEGTRRIGEVEAREMIPLFRPGKIVAALAERHAYDLDVDAIHRHFMKKMRADGGTLHLSARVIALEHDAARWTVSTARGLFRAPVVVNAAGAWADEIADLAGVARLGLDPRRRTAALVDPPAGVGIGTWPMVVDIEEQFYFKPEAGKILVSPADETRAEPCDAYPEDLDVAIAVDRVQTVLDIDVRRVSHSWAGLRTFAPDRTPIVGYDQKAAGFFWLAGQGGYGIQTAPALSRLAAELVREKSIPADLADLGLISADLAPTRFKREIC